MDPIPNLMAPSLRKDPYPVYAELRREHPICRVEPGGLWAVSRYSDVLAILRDPARFSNQAFQAAWQPPWVGYNPLANSVLALDPPVHTRLRALVTRAFGNRSISRLEPRVQEVAGRLAAALDEQVEFISAFAMPLPAFAIGEILGLGQVDGPGRDPGNGNGRALHGRFKAWADDILSVTPAQPADGQAERVRSAIAELTGHLEAVVRSRRAAPGDDVTSDLLAARVDGQALSDREVIDFLVTLLLGGLETTTHLLGNSALLLAERPELLERLRAEPALVPRFVDEMIRYDGPSQALPRVTTTEVELAGVRLPPGTLVLALVGSANRDERQFPNPDRFDLARGQLGLQFGFGVHYCIGAALARLEATAAVQALVARVGRIRLAGEVEYNQTLTVRGPARLPLQLEF
ncbi:MAG: cytochrome P450 [Polyangia bacterium]